MNRAEWNRRYAGTELLWTAEPNRFLVEETAGLAPGRALDLACGEGRNAVWLAERGWRVAGVDFSDVAIEKARRLAARRGVDVEWIVADVLEYEPEPAAFDLVAVFYLQVAGAARRVVFPRAARAVALGGLLLFVAHDSRNLDEGHGGPSDPAVLYSPSDVVAHLDGLAVERAETVVRPVEAPEGVRNALDVIVRATRPR